MQLTVKGKQLDVGDALRTHIDENLTTITGKYFTNPIEATVVLSRDAHLYRADVSVHVGRNILLQSSGEAGEAYSAFDQAADRVGKRLRRYKRRLKDHHKETSLADALPADSYVLEGASESGAADAEEEAPDQPIVIAEMKTQVESLRVDQAVMRLDLADLPALMFRNPAHGGLNMVYRRPDGNIGWVDPKGSPGPQG